MDAFSALRKQARERRDRIIAKARADYEVSLVRIAAIEQDLGDSDPPNLRSIASCVNRVIPDDRTFTTADIFTALAALDPERDWRSQSIHSHISRLRSRGTIRRLKRAYSHDPAVYARVGGQADSLPSDDRTLVQTVADLVRERGPLRATEIAVILVERGYRTTTAPKRFRESICRILRAGAYQKRGGKWTLAK